MIADEEEVEDLAYFSHELGLHLGRLLAIQQPTNKADREIISDCKTCLETFDDYVQGIVTVSGRSTDRLLADALTLLRSRGWKDEQKAKVAELQSRIIAALANATKK